MDQVERLLDVFRRACSPPERLSVSEWASGRVVIADGLTPKYQVENAPWQIQPLDSIGDPEAHEIVYLAPIGTGKTTFMEAGLQYIIAQDPGPTLLVGQTDDDLKDWAETRMDYAIRNTPDTARLLPTDRHKRKKMQILFPHMSLFLTGANVSGLQSKSMRRVFCDEVWQYRPGMVNYARGRLHDRWNRQIFLMSQAGTKDDELDKAWEQTNKCEFMFPCPCCGTVQQWKWCNVTYSADESLTNLERAQTAGIKCDNEECDWVCPDSPQPRRQIAEAAKYVATATGLPGHLGYHYNVLCNWRKPLWELVLLWLNAKRNQASGNLDQLRQFIQQRLAEPWEEDLTDNRTELVGDGYSMAEFSDGRKVDNEGEINGKRTRFLTVDVQQDHFWVVLRAWRNNGESLMLHFGRHETFDQVNELALKYQVEPAMVFVDSGYASDTVYSQCALRGWTALKGSRAQSFPWRTKDGKAEFRAYQKFTQATCSNGSRCRFAHWSSDRAKDILYSFRTGKGGAWMLPDDAPAEYIKQIDSERKEAVENAKTKQVEYRWIKRRRDNHAWDCEAMQVVAALMLRLIPGFDS